MNRLPAAVSVVLFLLLPAFATPSRAWTPDTSKHVAENAARLMPTTLRAILYTHKESLLSGAAAPGTPESSSEHQGAGREGVRARIIAQVATIRKMMEARAPFQDVAHEMGVLSHFLADANNPLNVSDRDPREGEYRHDYSRYVEANLDKFPLVFSGYRSPELESGDVEGFVDTILGRSRSHYPRIGQDYIRKGELVSSKLFDEFSFAFGVGALSTSNAVGDTARVWLYLWEAAGGDIRGLPYPDNRLRAAAPPAPTTEGPAAKE